MDERNKQVAGKIIAIMYFITIIAMQGIVIYRQFVLKQTLSDFEDIAILMTVNSIFLVSALLYFGGIPYKKLEIKSILLIYLGFVLLGGLFTYVKYNIFQSPGLSFQQLIEKFGIIATIIGLLMGFWIVLSIMGKRKIDKEIEE